MNTYVILLHQVPNRKTERGTIERHIAHLRNLQREGQLVLCGPFTDHAAGMVVVKVPTRELAIQLAEQDPFVSEGARTYELRTWLLANEENNYLA